MVGGASANLNLRKRLEALCQKNGCELLLAPLAFCSDNALMIARAGREKYLKKDFISHDKLKKKNAKENQRNFVQDKG